MIEFTQEVYDDMRLNIFENEIEGNITESTRDKLLESLDAVVDGYNEGSLSDNKVSQLLEAIEERADGYIPESRSTREVTEYVTKEEYNSIRRQIFEDAYSGRISEDEKMMLLERANDRYDIIDEDED